MQVTKGTWRMREQCVPGSLSSSPAREPGNEASSTSTVDFTSLRMSVCVKRKRGVLTLSVFTPRYL